MFANSVPALIAILAGVAVILVPVAWVMVGRMILWYRVFDFLPYIKGVAHRQNAVNQRLTELFTEMLAWFELEKWVKVHITPGRQQDIVLGHIRTRTRSTKMRAWGAHEMARHSGFRYYRKARLYLPDPSHHFDLHDRFCQLRRLLLNELPLDEKLLDTPWKVL